MSSRVFSPLFASRNSRNTSRLPSTVSSRASSIAAFRFALRALDTPPRPVLSPSRRKEARAMKLCTLSTFVALVCLSLAVPRPASAQDSSHKLSAMDEFQLQLPSDPQISPDGKQIVYVRRFADPMTDRRYSNLWIINAEGTDHRPLTTGNRNDSSPRWSPDGTRIAYLSDADGKRLSYSSLVPGKGPHLADLPAPPAGAKWAEPASAYDRTIYRFNGAGYLKPGFMQIFVVGAEGGAPRQVTNGQFANGGNEFGPTRASWTPDGKFLIVSANRHPESDHESFDTEIYEFAVADG